VWLEVQWLARLSGHPHLIPLRHLVVVEGLERGGVVGFTVLFLPGGSLEASRKIRPFKLKWAKQLCQVVDDLNLQYGIAHTDVRACNMMVDPATDNLVLIDFGTAARRGKISQRGLYVPPNFRSRPASATMSFTRTDYAPLAEPQPGHAAPLRREGEEPNRMGH